MKIQPRFNPLLLVLVAFVTFSLPVSAQEEEKQTLFRNVNVFDGTSNRLTMGQDVLVEGNLISQIGQDLEVPADATVIDGGGRTLMPGLIDSHVHMTHAFVDGDTRALEGMTWEEIGAGAAAAAREAIMNGFTTVRDMGGMGTGFKRAIDKGLLVGPRIYAAGAYITQTGGHADLRLRSQPNSGITGTEYSNLERLNIIRIADGVPAMLAAVRENFSEGAAYIKIHAGGGVSSQKDPLFTIQYTPEELRAAKQAVENWDTYFTVHAYTSPTIAQALDAGAECIDHGQMMSEEIMRRIVSDGIFLSTNLTAMSEDVFKHPVYGDPKNPVHIKTKQFIEGSSNFVELVKTHQPKWVFNSDIVLSTQTYYRQHLDHEKYIAGEWFGNHFALKGMTSVPGQLAQLTGQNNPYPGKLGVIEAGAYADILLVDGNPLEDLSAIGANPGWFDAEPRTENVESIRLIMKDGVVYKNTL